MIKITTPLTKEIIRNLKAGEEVLLSGYIYTARDQAHMRLVQQIKSKKRIPFDLRDQIIYYCGPTKTPPGRVIGSCGPTTSSRMDKFTPQLFKRGLKGMIGKGSRSKDIAKIIKLHKAVYFLAPAGCGALLAKKIRKVEVIAYSDLGPEAIRRLKVEDFPLIVGIDSRGRSIYGTQ